MSRIHLTAALGVSAALCLACLGINTSANAGGVAAQNDNDGSVVKLRYSQADLGSAQGAKALAQRIREAADRACHADALFAADVGVESDCREAAVNRAIKDLHAPLLADAALGPSGRALSSARH